MPSKSLVSVTVVFKKGKLMILLNLYDNITSIYGVLIMP